MTRTSLRLWLLVLLLSAPAAAAPLLTLTPPDGAIFGPPGGSPTWQIVVTDDGFPVLTSVSYVTLVPVGVFSFSLITDWSAVGQYDIDPFAAPGSLSTGTIEVGYDLYSSDPSGPGFDPDLDYLGSNVLSADASVQVSVGEVPEPAYGPIVGLLLTGFLLGRVAGSKFGMSRRGRS